MNKLGNFASFAYLFKIPYIVSNICKMFYIKNLFFSAKQRKVIYFREINRSLRKLEIKKLLILFEMNRVFDTNLNFRISISQRTFDISNLDNLS